MEQTVDRPALKYHGGKFRLAPWILSHFPSHRCYVEPFGGAAGVLLQKERAHVEVYNDLDGDVVNLFRVLRNPDLQKRLIESLIFTPYARYEFELAFQDATCPVEAARRLCVRAAMGFGSAGATKGRTGFHSDTARPCATAQHLWASYPDSLARVAQRLSGVLIENQQACLVMRAHDAADTLHYVDPPYVMNTRVAGSRYYRHEMTDEQHQELLECLRSLKGMVVLSGYDNPIYQAALQGWERCSKQVAISAYRGSVCRVETLWLNPACSTALHGWGLFGALLNSA